MKRNLLSVLILVLLIVNLLVSSVIAIVLVPQTKASNDLIKKVASAINLELSSDDSDTLVGSNLPIDQLDVYALSDKLTINLKKSSDEKKHYVVLDATLALDTKNKDYKKYKSQLSEKESLVRNVIISTISNHTVDEMNKNQASIRKEITKGLQKLFDSDFIVDVAFASATVE